MILRVSCCILLLLSCGAARLTDFLISHQAPTDTVQIPVGLTRFQLRQHAEQAHRSERFGDELVYRQSLYKATWDIVDNREALNEYERYAAVFSNDIALGLLLEGDRRWTEAESVFRHSRAELARESIAGNDSKSENELLLAHLLAKEGRTEEAESICKAWKGRVKHNADFAAKAVRTNLPQPPLYDTPQVEIARWDLACGLQAEGFGLLTEQMREHPAMLAPSLVLSRYYLGEGDYAKARQLERETAKTSAP